MRSRSMFVALVATAIIALAAAAVPALAAPPGSTPPGGASWQMFGNGHWAPGTGNESQFGLVTTSAEDESAQYGVTYGGAYMKDNMLPTSDPSAITALSFEFMADQTGASGGSPRLVVQFSDEGQAELRPLTWVAGEWSTVNGMQGNNWDNNGGECGYLYGRTWEEVVACHPEASITSIFVVNDSGWLYPEGETVVLDNLTVNNTVAGGPGASL